MKVFKYPIPPEPQPIIELPYGAKILHFGAQGPDDLPFIWALVDENEKVMQKRVFRLAGTGHEMVIPGDMELTHVGTAQIGEASKFVFHLFEITYVVRTTIERPN